MPDNSERIHLYDDINFTREEDDPNYDDGNYCKCGTGGHEPELDGPCGWCNEQERTGHDY